MSIRRASFVKVSSFESQGFVGRRKHFRVVIDTQDGVIDLSASGTDRYILSHAQAQRHAEFVAGALDLELIDESTP